MKSNLIYLCFLSCVRATTRLAVPLAIVFFSVLLLAGSTYGQSVPGFQAPDKPKVKDSTSNAVKATRGEVPFNKMYGHLKLDSAKLRRLGQLSPNEQKNQKDDKLLRIGVVRPLETPLEPLSDSALYPVTEGYIRVAGLASEGADGVRVQFKDMSLPAGARVFVYSLTNPNEYYGPYEGRGTSEDGTFWTPAIHGDTAVIEYFTPTQSDSLKTPFTVSSIAHVYKDTTVVAEPAGSCELDVSAAWQNVAKAVGRIDFVSQGGLFSCSGTLLNNQANDQKPYFLTANHCISTQSEAQTAVVYWNYNTGDEPPAGTPATVGANLLATAETSDSTLLLLTGSVPGGLFFSGWDSSTFSVSAPGTGIHHPQGSHKRISFGTARLPNPGNCFPGQPCLRVDWSSGVTEPGSSGSGLWVGNPSDPGGPRLIGALSAGQSACGVSPANNWDIYGRLSDFYPSIAPFLEGRMCVASLSPTNQIFKGSGGTGSFNVTAAGTCNWTAVPSDSFITITSGATGSGNGTVTFSLASNTGPLRSAQIVVSGQVFNIAQGGAPRNLTVTSSNPNSGISVTVNPTDNNGFSNGTTQFTRTYDQGTIVNLNAPGTAGGGLIFLKWQRDGVDVSSIPVTSVLMDADHTLTAVYGPTPTYTLTVASTNPSSGVPITITPNDNGGLGNGSTQFTRTYTQFTLVQLKAPISAGNTYFQKWQADGFDVTTNRVTNVIMNSNHTMTAVYITLPTPTPTPTPTPSGPGQAVTYQIDPAHTGSQFDTVTPPLTQRWSRDLGGSVSYPLIAGGKVFVLAGTTLYALNGANGATVWGPIEIGTAPSIAYDSGRVFAINFDGLLRAFDASNGTQLWSQQLSGPGVTSPLSAMGGTIYVAAISNVFAVSGQDGTVKWTAQNRGGSHSSPAVSTTGVYLSYSCNTAYALSPSTGATIWTHTSTCTGGGGRTSVFYNGRVYIRDTALENLALDSGTGIAVADFSAGPAPAFHGSTGFFLTGSSTLEARDISSGTLKWSFTGDGNLSSAPIVVNGVVYIGSTGGKLFGVDESSGTNVWTGTVGAPVNRPDENNISSALTGLGAGEGLVVVPASNLVVAYESAPVSTTPVIYVEEGTNNAVALDSVTFAKGPFRLFNPINFSSDQRTRIILLTSNLGLSQSNLSDPTVLVVELGGVNLPVENVGSLSITGLSSSYVIVRLPDNTPTGTQELKVKLRGVASDTRLLTISP